MVAVWPTAARGCVTVGRSSVYGAYAKTSILRDTHVSIIFIVSKICTQSPSDKVHLYIAVNFVSDDTTAVLFLTFAKTVYRALAEIHWPTGSDSATQRVATLPEVLSE
jgi:hypothetical protein